MKILRVQQLFCSGKLDGATENFHGLFEFFKRRERRRKTNVTVVRVFAVRERRTGIGQDDARFFTQLHDALCAAVKHIDADEIAAVRLIPLGDAEVADIFLQHQLTQAELRLQNGAVALHEGAHTVDVVQEQHMAQLIQLIRADGGRERVLLEIADIVIARGEAGHTGTRERNLGRRGKNEDLIFRAVFNARS